MGTRTRISMYLGSSKYWWAYLGLLSNPALRAEMQGDFDRAVWFDESIWLAEAVADGAGRVDRYFFVFWDGILNASLLEEARAILGPEATLSAIYVGVDNLRPEDGFETRALYPDGSLVFGPDRLQLDERTADRVRKAKGKNWLMPFKNLAQNRKSVGSQLDLLLGAKKVVFCGSYGTIPEIMESLCERFGVSAELFRDYPYYLAEKKPSYATYLDYLERDGYFLSKLLDAGAIGAGLFLAAVHLLAREYFVEQIRESGMAFFVNGYATGVNVNVYTTPFYRQHVYVDFGSVVGRGNYPRLADLQYFRKMYVEIAAAGELEELAGLARAGGLASYFGLEWNRRAAELMAAMR